MAAGINTYYKQTKRTKTKKRGPKDKKNKKEGALDHDGGKGTRRR